MMVSRAPIPLKLITMMFLSPSLYLGMQLGALYRIIRSFNPNGLSCNYTDNNPFSVSRTRLAACLLSGGWWVCRC